MALLPFLSDMSRQSERWGPDGGGAALRNEVDHMPTDADLSPLVRMGTRLNRDALRAFLNDNVEQLADEVKREMSDGREDGGGGGGAGGIGGGGGGGDDAMDEGGGSSSSSSDAMVGAGASFFENSTVV